MNSHFTVKVKYTKQLDDGTFKRVSETYLLGAMTFTDAEARIYDELGTLIRGEFLVTGISRTDIHDIFHYEDSDIWWKCIIKFESGDGGEEGAKAKKVSQNFLVTAHSAKEAYDRVHESLGGMLIDFQIPTVTKSPIVDIFPFGDDPIPEIVKEAIAELSVDEGYTLYSSESTSFPEEGEQVDVILENGDRCKMIFWSVEEGFDGQTEPHHWAVIAWRREKNTSVKFVQEADDERFQERVPHTFCVSPDEKCTMNFCDENGCQNRPSESSSIEIDNAMPKQE